MLQSYDAPVAKPKAKPKAKTPRATKPKAPRDPKERAPAASKKKQQLPEPMDTSAAYAAFAPLADDDVAPDPFDCWGGFDEPMNAEVCRDDDDNRSTTSDGYTDSHATTVFSDDDGGGDGEESCDSPTPAGDVRFLSSRGRGSSSKSSRHVFFDGPRVVEEDDSGIF